MTATEGLSIVKSLLRRAGVASCILLWIAANAAAQETHIVRFAPGTTGTTESGSVVGDKFHDFVVDARAGQVMRVNMTGSQIVYFNVLPPGSDNEAIFIGSTEGNDFAGTLGASGRYKIRVYQMRATARRGERGRFRLAISVDASDSSNASGGGPAGISGIAGMDSVLAIDEMSARGFADVDSFSSGNTQYGIFFSRPTRMCVQLTMAEGVVVDARDIKTHPKCR